MSIINALFVETKGPYFGVPGVEPWDMTKDAKTCRNGLPAIAHPPCERWGRYWFGGPSVKERKSLGDDAGCFAFALWYVRTHGGVIEHPEASHAFKFFGLPIPERKGNWSSPDIYGGRSCCVEQGHYGHPARKATWLYAIKTDFPELIWGPCETKKRLDPGFHSKEEAKAARILRHKICVGPSRRQSDRSGDSMECFSNAERVKRRLGKILIWMVHRGDETRESQTQALLTLPS